MSEATLVLMEWLKRGQREEFVASYSEVGNDSSAYHMTGKMNFPLNI